MDVMNGMLARVKMGALINGNECGVQSTVELPMKSGDDVLYPGASLGRAQAVTFNFGYRPFMYVVYSHPS
jgi:predicted 2-oxoglutarate/Fe(II)-dependent dioxygenase YbiX